MVDSGKSNLVCAAGAVLSTGLLCTQRRRHQHRHPPAELRSGARSATGDYSHFRAVPRAYDVVPAGEQRAGIDLSCEVEAEFEKWHGLVKKTGVKF